VTYQTYTKKGTNPPIYKYSTVPVTDRRNNVVALVYTTGIDAGSIRAYDLHGQEANPASGTLYMPHRFAGRQWDAESDLYYYRSRYYDPSLGRFISLDTIGIWGDLNNYGNGYAYVGNMGNSGLDPWGRSVFMYETSESIVIEVFLGTPQAFMGGDDAAALQAQADSMNALFTGFEYQGKSVQVNVTLVPSDENHRFIYEDREYFDPKTGDPILGSTNYPGQFIVVFKEGKWELTIGAHELGHLLGLNGIEISGLFNLMNEYVEDHGLLTDEQMAAIIEWIRTHCNNTTGKCTPDPPAPPPSGMTLDGNSSSRSREDWQFLSATGRIKEMPSERRKISEYWYDGVPLRLRLKTPEEKKRFPTDGRGKPVLPWRFGAIEENWIGKMGLLPSSRSGVIDPVR
jgi:RHS repeat-associated protein